MMVALCDHCGFPSPPGHDCPERHPNPDIVRRLREDHTDTVECEHGFTLHRTSCPNVVCLARDLREAAAEIERLRG